jgi:hypothetical protein
MLTLVCLASLRDPVGPAVPAQPIEIIESFVLNQEIGEGTLEIDNPDDSFHCVLLPGCEIHRKVKDVAGFDTDHLRPFIVRKIGKGVCLLRPRIPHDGRA